MGWANWNHYFCDYDESVIRRQADALVATGMRDLGYTYVLIQECIASERDASGLLRVETSRFPSGMKRLVDYIHQRGMKAGIYTDVGPNTCFPGPRYQGSFNHERQDAATFAEWGVDLVEVDYCNKPVEHSGRELYERMAAAIHETGRPMLLYICSSGNQNPWEWAQGKAQLWRTDADISFEKDRANWARILDNFASNARHAVFSGPDSWNDPDMLEVGMPGLSLEEQRTHFSMWAISAAPLWASADLPRASAEVLRMFTNREVVAVDQDPLGAGPIQVSEVEPGLQVWAKPLHGRGSGEFAVLLLNLTSHQATIPVLWKDLGLRPQVSVRDLWQHKDAGAWTDGYSATVPSHGAALLVARGRTDWKRGILLEAEWSGNTRENAELLPCPDCSQGYSVRLCSTGHGKSSCLSFRAIDVVESGEYHVALFYGKRGEHPEQVVLQTDDGAKRTLSLEQRIHGKAGTVVRFKQGENSVTVDLQEPGDVELDAILLTK